MTCKRVVRPLKKLLKSKAVRRLGPQDVDEFRKVYLESLRLYGHNFTADYTQESAKKDTYWQSFLAAEADHAWFGVFSDTALVGIVKVSRINWHGANGHLAVLGGLYVPQDAHGLRLDGGQRISDVLIQACIAWTCKHPELEILYSAHRESNKPSQTALERNGFKVWGIRPKAFRTDDGGFEGATALWLDCSAEDVTR